jgi:hypothetical protein
MEDRVALFESARLVRFQHVPSSRGERTNEVEKKVDYNTTKNRLKVKYRKWPCGKCGHFGSFSSERENFRFAPMACERDDPSRLIIIIIIIIIVRRIRKCTMIITKMRINIFLSLYQYLSIEFHYRVRNWRKYRSLSRIWLPTICVLEVCQSFFDR